MCLLSNLLFLCWFLCCCGDNIFKILSMVQHEQNTHAYISYRGWGNTNTTQLQSSSWDTEKTQTNFFSAEFLTRAHWYYIKYQSKQQTIQDDDDDDGNKNTWMSDKSQMWFRAKCIIQSIKDMILILNHHQGKTISVLNINCDTHKVVLEVGLGSPPAVQGSPQPS